ncbi:MAG: hypothetical protein Q9226_002510 [Calogaya cf. arnoldii]
MSLTPGKPTQWSGVLFVRKGPYAPAVLRFQLFFPAGYPDLPPLITFITDIFHPLVTPVTHGANTPESGAKSAADEQPLPPGAFGLTDGFPHWFGGSERNQLPAEHMSPRASIAHVLDYVKSSFDDSEVLNRLPAEAATNPGAWKAWQAYRSTIERAIESSDIITMELCSAVSPPSKKPVKSHDDQDLTPRPLRINKRKRQPSHNTCTAQTRLAPGGRVPAVKVRRAATMSYPPTFLTSHPTCDPDTATDPTRPSRAVTLGTIHPHRPHVSRNHSSNSRKLSKSVGKADRKGSPDADSDHTVRRLPSFRHRILSRVMNSLIGRSSSGQSVADEGDRKRPSLDGSTSNRSAGLTTDARTSFSTTDASSSTGTDLETALSEFPEPPRLPATLSAFQQAQLNFQANRKLYAPTNVAITHPDILITPELDSVDSNKDRSLYVAVEVSAVTEAGRKTQDDRFCGLDIAVIIDNSLFASPATLMASCETARFLSSLLNSSNDRMAIICTSSLSAEHPDLRTLMPLTCVSPRRTKAIVDGIISSTERPSPLALGGAVRSARALLEQSTPRNQNSGLGPSAFGHIFILTCHPSGLPPELLVHDKIQLHLVCPGSVPWKSKAKVRCNGWKLQSMRSRELHFGRYTKDEDPSSLFNKLRTTIADARTGSLHGAVSDLVLDLKPGGNCTIESVIGQRNISSLQLGEKVVALVTLKIGLAPAAGYTLRPRRNKDGSNSACNDPDKELDALLGTTPVNVLSATLRYKHSLLPLDTHCTLTTDCRMKRPLPSAQWTDLPQRPSVSKHHHPQIEVQKQFAFHIATHHEPRQAMMVLIEEFGDGGRRSACPDYIRLLVEELKYQARTIERFDLADYRSGPITLTPREMRPDVWGQEHFGHGLFDASNYRPQEWITDAPDEVPIQFPVRSSSKSEARHHACSDETTDEARKIWLDLKRKSRKPCARSGSENSVPRELDEATRRLKDLALRNKRSVGADSLKCLAYPEYRGRAIGSYSPWL